MGRPASSLPRVTFRLPPELLKQIEHAAAENERSLNAEIVHRLQFTFDDPDGPLTDPEKIKLHEIVLESLSRTLLEAPDYAAYLDQKGLPPVDLPAKPAKEVEVTPTGRKRANQIRGALREIGGEPNPPAPGKSNA